jgi:membrane fusion protein, multidrug efflux system
MKNMTGTLVFIIAFTLFATSCINNPSKEKNQINKTDSVAAFILQKGILDKEISFPGELLPIERAEIFAKVSGYVNSLKVDIGDIVQKGQVIAILDAPEILANYAQVNSDMQTSKSKYTGSLDAFRRTINAAKTEGTIVTGDLERIKSQMMADSSTLEAARFKLNAYAQLKDYLIIRAPLNGVVTQRNIDPGTLVGTVNSKPLLVIENNSILRLRLSVPETYTSVNCNVTSVNFTVDTYPDIVFEAKLSRKAGALDLNNRTETWEFIYPNKDKQLKSGMFVNATLKFGRAVPSFIVNSAAIVTSLEKRFVIRLKNGRTEWVDVRNGIAADNKTEIFGSLSEGDTLLVRGTDEIKQNLKFVPKFQPK